MSPQPPSAFAPCHTGKDSDMSKSRTIERAKPQGGHDAATARPGQPAHFDDLLLADEIAAVGISEAQYEAILARQGGVCAICAQHPDEPLWLDFCHITGRLRGLLCGECKAGLVCFGEDPRLLREASAFLRARPRR
jgi:Recombination endonuclease VII